MEIIEKNNGELVKVQDSQSSNYATKGVAGAGLGLGIAGTALWLLNSGLGGGGLFGNKSTTSAGTVINEMVSAGTGFINSLIARKETEREYADKLELTNAMWQHNYDQQQERYADRSVLNQEFFDLYQNTSNKFADAESKRISDAFNLYKYSRDNKDAMMSELNDVKTELAVLKATRPYQDKIIQMSIDNTAQTANFNLFRRTCRMIEGELVLPTTPTVTGLPSYYGDASQSNAA